MTTVPTPPSHHSTRNKNDETACSTNVNVTMRFGSSSISWPVSNADFSLMQISSSTCVGGFFALDTSGTSAPPWIVGDTFLKNVYSVFRSNPAAVGFATLSSTATAMNGKNGAAPSPTVGSAAATVSGTTAGTGSGTNRSSTPNGARKAQGGLAVLGAWAAVVVSGLVVGSGLWF